MVRHPDARPLRLGPSPVALGKRKAVEPVNAESLLKKTKLDAQSSLSTVATVSIPSSPPPNGISHSSSGVAGAASIVSTHGEDSADEVVAVEKPKLSNLTPLTVSSSSTDLGDGRPDILEFTEAQLDELLQQDYSVSVALTMSLREGMSHLSQAHDRRIRSIDKRAQDAYASFTEHTENRGGVRVKGWLCNFCL
jgi:hypothetical protein